MTDKNKAVSLCQERERETDSGLNVVILLQKFTAQRGKPLHTGLYKLKQLSPKVLAMKAKYSEDPSKLLGVP